VARALAKTAAFEQSAAIRKRRDVFAHLKRILRFGRLRLCGPRGAQFELTFAALAQNLSRAKLVARTAAQTMAVRCCVAMRQANASKPPRSIGGSATTGSATEIGTEGRRCCTDSPRRVVSLN